MKKQNTNLELDAMDLEIDSFAPVELTAEAGHHIARIFDYAVVPEKVRDDGSESKAYVAITYSSDEGRIHARLYAAAVDSFVRNTNRQTHGTTCSMTLSQRLHYFKTHDIEVWTSWDDTYGEQVSYFDPELVKK